jgi:hypothetical protein
MFELEQIVGLIAPAATMIRRPVLLSGMAIGAVPRMRLKSKAQVLASSILSEATTAEMHRKQASRAGIGRPLKAALPRIITIARGDCT